MIKLRKDVREFAEAMEKTLQKHDPKKGDSWKTLSTHYLWQCLNQEWNEVNTTNLNNGNREFVDLANVCMMLYHRKKEVKS